MLLCRLGPCRVRGELISSGNESSRCSGDDKDGTYGIVADVEDKGLEGSELMDPEVRRSGRGTGREVVVVAMGIVAVESISWIENVIQV